MCQCSGVLSPSQCLQMYGTSYSGACAGSCMGGVNSGGQCYMSSQCPPCSNGACTSSCGGGNDDGGSGWMDNKGMVGGNFAPKDGNRIIEPQPKHRMGGPIRQRYRKYNTNTGPVSDPNPPCCQNPGYWHCDALSYSFYNNCTAGAIPTPGFAQFHCENEAAGVNQVAPYSGNCRCEDPTLCIGTGPGSHDYIPWTPGGGGGVPGPNRQIEEQTKYQRTGGPVRKRYNQGGHICPDGFTGIDEFGNNIC